MKLFQFRVHLVDRRKRSYVSAGTARAYAFLPDQFGSLLSLFAAAIRQGGDDRFPACHSAGASFFVKGLNRIEMAGVQCPTLLLLAWLRWRAERRGTWVLRYLSTRVHQQVPVRALADKPCLGIASPYRAAGRYATAPSCLATPPPPEEDNHHTTTPQLILPKPPFRFPLTPDSASNSHRLL